MRGSVRLHGRLVEWALQKVISGENLAISVDILDLSTDNTEGSRQISI